MNYQQIELALPHREAVLTIPVYEAAGTGLAYHHIDGKEEYTYAITHLASKKVIHGAETEYEVKQLLEKIAPLADWNKPEEEFANRSDLSTQILEIEKGIEQSLNKQIESACKQSMPKYLAEIIIRSLGDDILRRVLLYAFKLIPCEEKP